MQKINYSLIVSDFDGTLYGKDREVSLKTKASIEKYVQAGGIFAISTGRMPAGILPRVKELGLQGYVSCCQGAIIMDIQTKTPILEGALSYETTLKVVEAMENLGLHIHIYDFENYYSNMDDEALKYYQQALGGFKAKLIVDKPMSQFIKENQFRSYKVVAMVEAERNQEIIQKLRELHLPDCEITRSSKYLVEVVNTKYSKGTAVEFLANYHNVPIEKVVAIGDQCNDIPMIQKAGLGVAVQNADEALKNVAGYVSPLTNEEDAVAEIIEEFGYTKE